MRCHKNNLIQHSTKLKQNLKEDIKTNTITHRNDIQKEKETLKKNYDDTLNNLNQRLKNIIQRYKEKMKELEADLELRLKVEIHELEERKNLHINNLNKVFDDKMNTWKAENINQIKESIKIIKENIDVLKDLENDNKKLQKENDVLQKEIDELDKKYKEAKDINTAVKNRLAKYYNQEINMKNMKAKIIALREKCKETSNKTEDIEKQKQEIQEKIDDLKLKFRTVLDQYKVKTEHKNDMLDHHLKQLNDDTYPYPYLSAEVLMRGILSKGESNFAQVDRFLRKEIVNDKSYANTLEEFSSKELSALILGAFFGLIFQKMINDESFTNPDETSVTIQKFIKYLKNQEELS